MFPPRFRVLTICVAAAIYGAYDAQVTRMLEHNAMMDLMRAVENT